MNVSPFIKYSTYQIAKGMTPVDTGNLRHNAVRLRNVQSNSWTINYDTTQASYIEPLEEGSINMIPRRFIRTTANLIALYLKRQLTGRGTSQLHRNIMRNSLDVASKEEKIRREERRINSLLNYEVVQGSFKVYENKNIGVNL